MDHFFGNILKGGERERERERAPLILRKGWDEVYQY